MASKEHEKIIAFDTLFSTNHTQMLKILLPFMDNQTKKHLAIYIKFLELSYTINYLKKHPLELLGCADHESSFDFPGLCGQLLPFCNDKEKKQIEQMRGIFQSMEMYREMSKTMEAMKDIMPDMGDLFQNMQAASFQGAPDSTIANTSGMPASGFPITDILMNMMTPEQKEMYEMFKGDAKNAE